MSIELVTGYAGSVHVSSAQDGRRNAATFGRGRYVMPVPDNGFNITVNSANSVTISTGDAMFDGRHVTSEAPTTLAIDSGTQGMNRIDTVAIVYHRGINGVETVELQVYKGDESSGTPTAPTLPTGTILNNFSTAAMPLWNIPINGLAIGTPVKRFSGTPMAYDGTFNIDDIVADSVTVGGFPVLTTADSTQNVLWTGAHHMSSGQVANLSENISDQTNGVVLVWCLYQNGSLQDHIGYEFTFIPKKSVNVVSGGNNFYLSCFIGGSYAPFANKMLNVDDNSITGDSENNRGSHTKYGLQMQNSAYVLRYVIGV